MTRPLNVETSRMFCVVYKVKKNISPPIICKLEAKQTLALMKHRDVYVGRSSIESFTTPTEEVDLYSAQFTVLIVFE